MDKGYLVTVTVSVNASGPADALNKIQRLVEIRQANNSFVAVIKSAGKIELEK